MDLICGFAQINMAADCPDWALPFFQAQANRMSHNTRLQACLICSDRQHVNLTLDAGGKVYDIAMRAGRYTLKLRDVLAVFLPCEEVKRQRIIRTRGTANDPDHLWCVTTKGSTRCTRGAWATIAYAKRACEELKAPAWYTAMWVKVEEKTIVELMPKPGKERPKCNRIIPKDGEPCNRSFSNAWDLKRHERTVHNPSKLQCPECEVSLSRLDVLKKHMQLDHGKTYRSR